MENDSRFSHDEIRAALDSVATHLTGLTIAINNMREMFSPEGPRVPVEHFNPRDPANRGPDNKLTERGVEILYRLFDRGENRNKVATLMGISFTAANHRYEAWQKLGGPQRHRLLLEDEAAAGADARGTGGGATTGGPDY